MPRINTGSTEVLENLRPSRGKDGLISFECPLCRAIGRVLVSPNSNTATGSPGWWGNLGFARPVVCSNGHSLMVDKGLVRPVTDSDTFKETAPIEVSDRTEAFMNDALPWLSGITKPENPLQKLGLQQAGFLGRASMVEIAEAILDEMTTVEKILRSMAESAVADAGSRGPFSRKYALLAYFEAGEPQQRVIRVGG